MTTYIKTSLGKLAETGLLPPDARLEIRIDASKQIDADLRAGPAKYSDKTSDDFVNWNFKRSWRKGSISHKASFGVDYDYYNRVVDEFLSLWSSWVPGGDPDWIGMKMYDEASRDYKQSLGLWQNKKRVPFGTPLTGPEVTVGPTVDYGLFLEKWNLQRSPNAWALQQIGALHAIAIELQARWLGVHHIYATTTVPSEVKDIAERTGRDGEAIRLFPLVRIQSRHQ